MAAAIVAAQPASPDQPRPAPGSNSEVRDGLAWLGLVLERSLEKLAADWVNTVVDDAARATHFHRLRAQINKK